MQLWTRLIMSKNSCFVWVKLKITCMPVHGRLSHAEKFTTRYLLLIVWRPKDISLNPWKMKWCASPNKDSTRRFWVTSILEDYLRWCVSRGSIGGFFVLRDRGELSEDGVVLPRSNFIDFKSKNDSASGTETSSVRSGGFIPHPWCWILAIFYPRKPTHSIQNILLHRS